MLRLWRNVGERIVIADGQIFVKVVSNHNNVAAQIEISAPTLFPEPRTARVAIGGSYPLPMTEDVVLHVTEIERRGVRFEIEAPREISIDREEVYLDKKKERDGRE